MASRNNTSFIMRKGEEIGQVISPEKIDSNGNKIIYFKMKNSTPEGRILYTFQISNDQEGHILLYLLNEMQNDINQSTHIDEHNFKFNLKDKLNQFGCLIEEKNEKF